MTLYGAETQALWKVGQTHVVSFEMWCWRRMENVNWTNCVKNEEVLNRVREDWNILHTIKRSKAHRIGHILHRN
jgi:hypothetical protein